MSFIYKQNIIIMENKPVKLNLSKLNITKLKELLKTSTLEESEIINKRINILRERNKGKKSMNADTTENDENEEHSDSIIDVPLKTKSDFNLLRHYYAKKYGVPPYGIPPNSLKQPVNNINETINIDCNCNSILSKISKEYEIVEIRLIKKI